MVKDDEKNVVVKYETWLRLQRLRQFPERGSFDAVISCLLDSYQKAGYQKEAVE